MDGATPRQPSYFSAWTILPAVPEDTQQYERAALTNGGK